MRFEQITKNKNQFLPLLLFADEQKDMIDQYLERGELWALYDDELCCTCVVTDEGNGLLEIKNLAVAPSKQKQGYGRAMLHFIEDHYQPDYHTVQLGTGDTPQTVPFYEKCGFVRSHTAKDFFTDNYDHPIIECGILLRDMVYFKKELKKNRLA